MSRSLRERVKDPAWWGEQVAHGLIGAAIAAVVFLAGWLAQRRRNPALWLLVGAVVSALIGGVRELVQNWGDVDNSIGDAVVDAVVWAVCGAAVAVTGWGVLWRLRVGK